MSQRGVITGASISSDHNRTQLFVFNVFKDSEDAGMLKIKFKNIIICFLKLIAFCNMYYRFVSTINTVNLKYFISFKV